MLSSDEFTVLLIADRGEHVAPIGRWEAPVLALAQKGLMQCVDSVNYVITPAGKKACAERDRDDDATFRQILESGAKIQNARTQAQQSVEQAALHLSFAAKASILVTGDSPEHAVASWLVIVKDRALELLRNG